MRRALLQGPLTQKGDSGVLGQLLASPFGKDVCALLQEENQQRVMHPAQSPAQHQLPSTFLPQGTALAPAFPQLFVGQQNPWLLFHSSPSSSLSPRFTAPPPWRFTDPITAVCDAPKRPGAPKSPAAPTNPPSSAGRRSRSCSPRCPALAGPSSYRRSALASRPPQPPPAGTAGVVRGVCPSRGGSGTGTRVVAQARRGIWRCCWP